MKLTQDELLQIANLYGRLKGDLDKLVEAVMATPRLAAEVGVLPVRETNGPAKPTSVSVTWLKGKPARAEAAHAYRQLTYAPDQHPRATLRRPGVIAVTPRALTLAEKVNQDKDALMQLLPRLFNSLSHEDAESRYQELRDRVPEFRHLSVLQVRRHLAHAAPAPQRVRFYWSDKHVNSTRRTRTWVLDSLARRRAKAQDPQRRAELARYQRLITEALPSAQDVLAERRAVSPLPIMAIYSDLQHSSLKLQTPLLVPAADPFPVIRPLPDFDSIRVRAKRTDVLLEETALIPEFGYYLYASPISLTLLPETPAVEVRASGHRYRLTLPSVESLHAALLNALAFDRVGEAGEFKVAPATGRALALSLPRQAPLRWHRVHAQAFLKSLPM